MRPVFETLDTVQFTFTTSVAPNSGVALEIYDAAGAAVGSVWAASSDATHQYAFFTTPNTPGAYLGLWSAYKTYQGSAYRFSKRFAFNINNVRAE
jgi:hypothetical protein